MIFIFILGGLIGAILIYLSIIIFCPVLKVKPQPLNRIKDSNTGIPDCRSNAEYTVDGETIRSWFYLPPDTSAPVPCILLCNGFGGTKDIILEQYALKFIEAGFNAYLSKPINTRELPIMITEMLSGRKQDRP